MKRKYEKYNYILIQIFIIILILILAFNDLILLSVIITLLYTMYMINNNNNNNNINIINVDNETIFFKKLTSNIKKNINDNISNLSYPILIIKKDGEILWGNTQFKDELDLKDTNNISINSIFNDLDLERLLICDRDLNQKIKIKKYIYNIYASSIEVEKDSENNIYIVHFIEISGLKESDLNKESVMLIEVDNLTDVLETTEESNRPMIIADVEKMISSYAKSMNAMIIKYDFNKYTLSILDKYINSEIQNKFNILEKISKIDRGNTLEVTLSIGIGRGFDTPIENYNNSITAKELALGRGGDQVVIKNQHKITFFGGNTREIEKRTRVRARIVSKSLKQLVFESSNIFIMGHKNPDMDCLGSAVGVWSAVNQMGKKCSIILDNDINAVEYYLNKLKSDSKYNNLFIKSNNVYQFINDKTLLIIVDVHNKSYINNLELANKINKKIIIDHHRRSSDIIEGTLLNYIEVYASSTSEMVTELIQYMIKKPNLKKIEAEGLMAGMVMDTKDFQFKTGVRTFDAASFLRTLGADTVEVKKMFSETLEDYSIIADTIKNSRVIQNLAIAICPDCVTNQVMTARIADNLLTISGIEVCFVLCKIDNKVVMSARSLGDINVQIILEEIGGGGHMNMAGATLETDINTAVKLLEKSIAKHLKINFKK